MQLQLQGCHFCTKGCQNPRARGSLGAAARDLPVPIALDTCDPAANPTRVKKSRKRGKGPPTRRVKQKWTPRDGLLPLEDAPQPAEGALEVMAQADKRECRSGTAQRNSKAPRLQHNEKETDTRRLSVLPKEKLHRPRQHTRSVPEIQQFQISRRRWRGG